MREFLGQPIAAAAPIIGLASAVTAEQTVGRAERNVEQAGEHKQPLQGRRRLVYAFTYINLALQAGALALALYNRCENRVNTGDGDCAQRIHGMMLLDACLWGAAGAGAIEVSELYGAMKRIKDLPWHQEGELSLGLYLFTVMLRVGLGAFAAALCATTGPLGTAGAVAAGIAAPKLLEELGHHAHSVGVTSSGPAKAAVSQHADPRAPQPAAPAPAKEVLAAPPDGGPVDASH